MSTDDRRPTSYHDGPDPLNATDLPLRAERVAPEITVDTSGVFRAARRRKAGQASALTLVIALALGGGGWAVTMQPWAAEQKVLPGTPTTTPEPTATASAEPELSAEAQAYLDAKFWRTVTETRYQRGSEPPTTTRSESWDVRDSFGMVIPNVERLGEGTPEDMVGVENGVWVSEQPDGLRIGFGAPLPQADRYALPTDPAALEACLFSGYELEKTALNRDHDSTPPLEPGTSINGLQREKSGGYGDIIFAELPEQCRDGGEDVPVDKLRDNPYAVAFVGRNAKQLLGSLGADELWNAAWEVLIGLPGVRVEGTREDALGRSGTAFTFEYELSNFGESQLHSETYVYDTDAHLLLEKTVNPEDEFRPGDIASTSTYRLVESGPYEEMPPKLRKLYDKALAEKVDTWEDDNQDLREYDKQLENIEAWGLKDKEMPEEELEAAMEADLEGSQSGFGVGDLRGRSLDETLQDEHLSKLELKIHHQAKDGVPPGMVWKAESANGVPSALASFPVWGGTMHVWVTPED